MKLTKKIAPYLITAAIVTTPSSAHARNETVFNFCAGIAKGITSLIIYPYVGAKNLYEQANKCGTTGLMEEAESFVGRPIVKVAEEFKAALTGTNTNSLVEKKGNWNEDMEKNGGLVKAIRDTIPMILITEVTMGTVAAYNALKSAPIKYTLKNAFKKQEPTYYEYLDDIRKKLTFKESLQASPTPHKKPNTNQPHRYTMREDGR